MARAGRRQPGLTADPHAELAAERGWLAHARASRLAMIERLRPLLEPGSAADEWSELYVQETVLRQLADLAPPEAADFFGRIDELSGEGFHIGRRHIEDGAGAPVVIDWRAGVAAAFYRATAQDHQGLARRRRFSLDGPGGELVSFNDDRFDDPDAVVAGGIPDPVLAEMGAARTGAMREIVATIQAEQDLVIRAPADRCLVVQGGPGTGKTAVGLHRAAFLLFEQRERLTREGVLVVGPNRVFLDYIAHVLPSLGERLVQQRTLADLVAAAVKVVPDGDDPPDVAAIKASPRMAAVIERAALARIIPPTEALAVGVGVRTVRIPPEAVAGWVAAALAGRVPLNKRRDGFRALAARELAAMVPASADGSATAANGLVAHPAVKRLLDRTWPTIKPVELVEQLLTRPAVLAAAAADVLSAAEQTRIRVRRRRAEPMRWTLSDLGLLDEAHGLLNGVAVTYGHVVVDEAQDHGTLALRALARRCPSRSFTVLGDLAQSTGPAGQRRWEDVLDALGAERRAVEHLTVGYRVPGPVLDAANRLLPLTEVDAPASRSARLGGDRPRWHEVASDGGPAAAWAAVDAVVRDVRRFHPLIGVVVPPARVDEAVVALADAGLTAVEHVQALGPDEVALFGAEAVKGLEMDAVVVVDPAGILADGGPEGTLSARGARLLYVAMTRAVQRLDLVGDELPAALVGAVDARP